MSAFRLFLTAKLGKGRAGIGGEAAVVRSQITKQNFACRALHPLRTSRSSRLNQPGSPDSNSETMRQMRSLSPRSITCKGNDAGQNLPRDGNLRLYRNSSFC